MALGDDVKRRAELVRTLRGRGITERSGFAVQKQSLTVLKRWEQATRPTSGRDRWGWAASRGVNDTDYPRLVPPGLRASIPLPRSILGDKADECVETIVRILNGGDDVGGSDGDRDS